MFAVSLRHDDRVKRFSISQAEPSGWEVRFEEDRTVSVRHYHDWHRVERSLNDFQRQVMDLTERGWEAE
jgi:hypothetical protein